MSHYCTYCGSKLHNKVLCSKTADGQSNRLYLKCGYCGSFKHNIKACPKTYNGNALRTWHEDLVLDYFIKD